MTTPNARTGEIKTGPCNRKGETLTSSQVSWILRHGRESILTGICHPSLAITRLDAIARKAGKAFVFRWQESSKIMRNMRLFKQSILTAEDTFLFYRRQRGKGLPATPSQAEEIEAIFHAQIVKAWRDNGQGIPPRSYKSLFMEKERWDPVLIAALLGAMHEAGKLSLRWLHRQREDLETDKLSLREGDSFADRAANSFFDAIVSTNDREGPALSPFEGGRVFNLAVRFACNRAIANVRAYYAGKRSRNANSYAQKNSEFIRDCARVVTGYGIEDCKALAPYLSAAGKVTPAFRREVERVRKRALSNEINFRDCWARACNRVSKAIGRASERDASRARGMFYQYKRQAQLNQSLSAFDSTIKGIAFEKEAGPLGGSILALFMDGPGAPPDSSLHVEAGPSGNDIVRIQKEEKKRRESIEHRLDIRRAYFDALPLLSSTLDPAHNARLQAWSCRGESANHGRTYGAPFKRDFDGGDSAKPISDGISLLDPDTPAGLQRWPLASRPNPSKEAIALAHRLRSEGVSV